MNILTVKGAPTKGTQDKGTLLKGHLQKGTLWQEEPCLKNVWMSDKSWEPGMLLKTWKLWKLENLKTWKFENFENLKNDPWDMLNNFCFHV